MPPAEHGPLTPPSFLKCQPDIRETLLWHQSRHCSVDTGDGSVPRTQLSTSRAEAQEVAQPGETFTQEISADRETAQEHEIISIDDWEENKHDTETHLYTTLKTAQDDKSDDESDSENDDLGDLASLQRQELVHELYSTSVPNSSFLSKFGQHGSPRTSLGSFRKNHLGFASPRSFDTAHSSLASYVTAHNSPQTSWGIGTLRLDARSMGKDKTYRSATPYGTDNHYNKLIDEVVSQISLHRIGPSFEIDGNFDKLKKIVDRELSPLKTLAASRFHDKAIVGLIDELSIQLVDSVDFSFSETKTQTNIRSKITPLLLEFVLKEPVSPEVVPGQVFSSEWLSYLDSKGILLHELEQLDWSGHGQHVEYRQEDANNIPLRSEKVLGHSATAIIDSVRCRRIRLARKKICCNRRLKKEDAIIEVQHLQRLQHSHIVRVVGTYTLKKELTILLYPAAEWNLDEFMDELLDAESCSSFPKRAYTALMTFVGCLSNAVHFIHQKHVKHMDIKPKNLLVRKRRDQDYKIYVADFGIARAYKSAEDSETDSPISFTRAYAAPEVILQDKRGFSADVFSLGCVFIEMLATMYSSTPNHNKRQALLELRKSKTGDTSYYTNIDTVRQWSLEVFGKVSKNSEKVPCPVSFLAGTFSLVLEMIDELPGLRPSMIRIKEWTARDCCSECESGPEPFEAADAAPSIPSSH
ncbi:kinase-like domain-containing protein [Pyrenochaeta sp. MPI-SDFR-AT-0127]|nr:kinase-like domain-containing protein [Pyrenochaeta sp. MPI-SDFR-AT-0127]